MAWQHDRLDLAIDEGIEFQIEDVAKRNPKAKGARPGEFVNLALLKELDQSGFIDKLYKK